MTQLTKDLKQQEAYKAWRANKYKGLVAGCTGFGKSRLGTWAAKAVAGIPTEEDVQYWGDKVGKVLWVTPTETLRDVDLKAEFEKWGMAEVYDNNVKAICYASLHQEDCRNYHVVILDEMHHMTGRMYHACHIETAAVSGTRILMLSATPPKGKREESKVSIMKRLGGLVWQIDLDEGAELGLVSNYKITKILIPLDDKTKYIKSGTKEKPFMVTERAYHDYLQRIVTKLRIETDSGVTYEEGEPRDLSEKEVESRGKRLFMMQMKYNRFIYGLKSKEVVARKLMSLLVPKARTLIFAGSIEMCELLCAPYTYHSKLKTVKKDGLVKDMYLTKFRDKEIGYLGVVDAINEGVNIPNVKYEIITQCDSNPRKLAQRIGRGVRFELGHLLEAFILVAKGTDDESWTEKSLSYFDSAKVTEVERSLPLEENVVS